MLNVRRGLGGGICLRALLTGTVLRDVGLAVDLAALHELGVATETGDAAVVEHEDAVGMLNGARTLRDDDLGRVGQVARQTLADKRVGLGVDGARGVVENEDLRALQQGARNAQTLLLAAGDVGAALFDVGVVLLREALDELVRLSELADLHASLQTSTSSS